MHGMMVRNRKTETRKKIFRRLSANVVSDLITDVLTSLWLYNRPKNNTLISDESCTVHERT